MISASAQILKGQTPCGVGPCPDVMSQCEQPLKSVRLIALTEGTTPGLQSQLQNGVYKLDSTVDQGWRTVYFVSMREALRQQNTANTSSTDLLQEFTGLISKVVIGAELVRDEHAIASFMVMPLNNATPVIEPLKSIPKSGDGNRHVTIGSSHWKRIPKEHQDILRCQLAEGVADPYVCCQWRSVMPVCVYDMPTRAGIEISTPGFPIMPTGTTDIILVVMITGSSTGSSRASISQMSMHVERLPLNDIRSMQIMQKACTSTANGVADIRVRIGKIEWEALRSGNMSKQGPKKVCSADASRTKTAKKKRSRSIDF